MRKRELPPYGIERIHVEQFRNMKDLDIQLGQCITLIAGQNGTGKSTILGMLGQPFGMVRAKTIFGKSCRTKFTDIFNLSPDHDKPGDHTYYIDFRDVAISGGKQHIQVKSYPRANAKSHIRFVTGATREAGAGNIDYPVVYLGLSRTYPVGEVLNPQAENAGLNTEEISEFCSWYSRVIIPTKEVSINPVKMTKTWKKDTLLLNTGDYDFLANSAGQDNLGQILGAIISFQRIKNDMGDAYRGGLLLIDEIDATLFPASQTGLIDILCNVAPSLKLQIVCTTHSLHLIKHSLKLIKDNDVSITYLKKRVSGISAEENPSMDAIESDLCIEPKPKKNGFKVEIWCEDEEAKWFILKMLPTRLKAKCIIEAIGLSCGELGELAIRDAPALKNVLFIVDADGNSCVSKKIRDCSKRFILPGGNNNPEESIYNMLNDFQDDDSFWESCPRGYNQQIFTRNYLVFKDEWESNGAKKKRCLEKAWFRKEKATGLWGANGAIAYSAWSKIFNDEIEEFINNLEHRVDAVINRMEHENPSS